MYDLCTQFLRALPSLRIIFLIYMRMELYLVYYVKEKIHMYSYVKQLIKMPSEMIQIFNNIKLHLKNELIIGRLIFDTISYTTQFLNFVAQIHVVCGWRGLDWASWMHRGFTNVLLIFLYVECIPTASTEIAGGEASCPLGSFKIVANRKGSFSITSYSYMSQNINK